VSAAAVSAPGTPAAPQFSGHNRITTQALISTAQAAAAEQLGVPAAQVRAGFVDDGGLLALELSLPVPIPPLARVAADPGVLAPFEGSVLDRVRRAKGGILETVAFLSGAQLSRVDIRVTGITLAQVRVR
jgi:hypothetical protein